MAEKKIQKTWQTRLVGPSFLGVFAYQIACPVLWGFQLPSTCPIKRGFCLPDCLPHKTGVFANHVAFYGVLLTMMYAVCFVPISLYAVLVSHLLTILLTIRIYPYSYYFYIRLLLSLLLSLSVFFLCRVVFIIIIIIILVLIFVYFYVPGGGFKNPYILSQADLQTTCVKIRVPYKCSKSLLSQNIDIKIDACYNDKRLVLIIIYYSQVSSAGSTDKNYNVLEVSFSANSFF